MSFTEHIRRNDREKTPGPEHHASAPVDRRAARTRSALHQALIRLIVEREYDEITVADIADAANVGRSTFYAHFTDKDDLLRRGADNLRALLLREHGRAVAGEKRPDRRTLGFSRFMTGHLKEQHALYRAMMRGRAGPIILDRLRQFLAEIVRAELTPVTRASKRRTPPPEVAVQFVVGAYISVLVWWLDRGARESPEEIDAAFRDLAIGGLGAMVAS